MASGLETQGAQESKPQAEVKAAEEDDEATDDEGVNGGDKRAAQVPPRKRLKSLADVRGGEQGPKKVWKSRRPRGTKQGDLALAAKLAGVAKERGEEQSKQEEAQAPTAQAQEA